MRNFINALTYCLFFVLGCVVGIAALGSLVALILMVSGATGPNCEGKDPAWLGYCSEAPE